MIEIYGIKLSVEATAFLVLFLIDELLPVLPIKGNNIVQAVHGLVQKIKPFRKEDDAVRNVKERLREIQREINKL